MRKRELFFRGFIGCLLLYALTLGALGRARLSAHAAPIHVFNARAVIINEVAWGGTIASPETDEWIELYNPGPDQIDFNGTDGQWQLKSDGNSPHINIMLTGKIDGNGYYLLERQNDTVIDTIHADQIYYGPDNILDDGGEILYLYAPDGTKVDTVNKNGGPWPAGMADGYGSMERYGNYEDSDYIWVTHSKPDPNSNTDFRGNLIYGTPRAVNDATTMVPLTTTKITSITPNPSGVDLPVKVSVSVLGGPTIPAGTVAISGADTTCTITLASDGTGSCNVTFKSIGTKTITASYTSSDPTEHANSQDTQTHEVVPPIATTTSITNLSPNPALVNKDFSITVNVAPNTGTTKPTGTVTVSLSGTTLCTMTLSNGAGTCKTKFTTVGVKELTAKYNGEGVFTTSTDTATVDAFFASTTVISSDTPDPSKTNQQVSVTVDVTGGDTLPTGTVEITGANSNCAITLVDGTGSCKVNFYYSGTKILTATYNGDDTYTGSSDSESHVVSFPVSSSGSTASGSVIIEPILGISEFLPRPGSDWNNDGKVDVFDEFIEIINAGSINVNLSAYRLDNVQSQGSSSYNIPSMVLKPGERAVFFGSKTGIHLSDAGGTVRLLRGSTVIDAYTYGVARYPDQSWCRVPDRMGYWNQPCFPTPNLPNALTGTAPLPPGAATSYRAPVCLLPDTTPDVFVFAECEAGGQDIWNRQFWDNADDAKRLIDKMNKWYTVFE